MSDRLTVVSSDGHATANMPDYRPYLEARWRQPFDDFLEEYARVGSPILGNDPKTLAMMIDDDEAEKWDREMWQPGRLTGNFDPARRLVEMDREGIAAEVLFPDFEVPFELYSPFLAKMLRRPPNSEDVQLASARAYNRWLLDFCSVAPERFAPQCKIRFSDVDVAVHDIRQAKASGFAAVVLPYFDWDAPLYDPAYDRIWSELEEQEMPVNGHVAISGIAVPSTPVWSALPLPSVGVPIASQLNFIYGQQLLFHFIWGGVLDRHPQLKVILTELGSGWVVGALEQMDYKYEGSYLRSDIRSVVRSKPSELFRRQCCIGSSLLSEAEVKARHQIGVEQMMFGVDYPHHEGAWNGGTQNYIQATLGAAGVPDDEATLMLGQTAANVFGLDFGGLSAVAERVGPRRGDVLVPPTEEKFPRGDAHKPLSMAH